MFIRVITDNGDLTIDKGSNENIDPTSYPNIIADAVKAAYAGDLIQDDVSFDISVIF